MLIQGCATFANKLRAWAEESLTQAKTLELIPTYEIGNWDITFLWKGDLLHQALGRVTSGSWLYWCSEPLGDPKNGTNQNLGLLLRPTHSGRAISRVSRKLLTEQRPLLESNLIEPCKTTLWVVAPSVFRSNDEKVICRLQIDELLDVYDMEVLTQKGLGNYWRRGHCSPSCTFARAVPLKVGIKVTCLFYDKLRRDDLPNDSLPVNDLAESCKRSVSDN